MITLPIRQLVSLSPADYEELYNNLIVQKIHPSKNNNHQLIKNISHSLKRRRAYLLPIGSDSEAIYHQQEAWTYAVFTAALWFYCPEIDNVKVLMPEKGLNWLKQHIHLYHLWSNYLAGKENVFSNIIGHQKQKNQVCSPNNGEQAVLFPGKDFFDWLIHCINSNNLHFIHRVEDGYLIAISEALEAYSGNLDIESIGEKLLKNPAGGLIPIIIVWAIGKIAIP